jgi:serine/threonine protein kinase
MGRKGIIHRDLKPENILLTSKDKGNYEIKIADFGYAMSATDERSCTIAEHSMVCGTAGYIAPEALAGKGYSSKSDVFSAGSILFSMLCLKNLFTGSDYRAIIANNKTCNLDILDQKLAKTSVEARSLVRSLLSKDPL